MVQLSPTCCASCRGVHCCRVHHSMLMAAVVRPHPAAPMVLPWRVGVGRPHRVRLVVGGHHAGVVLVVPPRLALAPEAVDLLADALERVLDGVLPPLDDDLVGDRGRQGLGRDQLPPPSRWA